MIALVAPLEPKVQGKVKSKGDRRARGWGWLSQRGTGQDSCPRLVKLRQRRNSPVELESLILVQKFQTLITARPLFNSAPLSHSLVSSLGGVELPERDPQPFSPTNQASAPGWHLRTMSNPIQSFDSPRRSAVFGRQPEELHIPSTGLINPNLASRQPQAHDYPPTPDAGASTQVPAINVHSSASSMQYAPSGSGAGHNSATLPGSLTPGGQHRPPAVSVNTAPSVIPTLPQSTPQQPSHRTSMINSHGHSRSSPAGFDQSPMYKQHGASEASKYPASPGAVYPPHTPQGSKYSPLGLADIRPPGDHLLGESLMSPGSLPYNGDTQIPTNSNYVAPWPIYAADWCKWPISGSSSSFGGKIALGSYLEDNHNYVRLHCAHHFYSFLYES